MPINRATNSQKAEGPHVQKTEQEEAADVVENGVNIREMKETSNRGRF